MSEQQPHDDWWQASDLRWYPPEQAPGRPSRAKRGWFLTVGLITVLAVVASGVTYLLVGTADEASAAVVVLEPLDSIGEDPFTDSVTITEVAEFPAEVRAVTAEVTATFAADDTTGTLLADGDTPGLYGGTRDESACDAEQLGRFLADNAAQGAAWAGVVGVGVDEIQDYLAGLSSVVLTTDTWVTNHGFSDGVATPRSSVLQAGTAVLVDSSGTPRAKCSCGNPLAPPPSQDLADVTTRGTAWSGYAPDTVTTVRSGTPAESLTLVDVNDGDTFQQPVGTPAEPTAEPVTVEPVTEDELMNLEVLPAEGVTDPTPIDLMDGQWTDPSEFGGSISVNATAIGDLDGDEVDDGALVLLSEAGGGGNAFGISVIVLLAADRQQLRVEYGEGLGDDRSIAPTTASEPAIEQGALVLRVSAGAEPDPRCCPSLAYLETFALDGGVFGRTGLEQILAG